MVGVVPDGAVFSIPFPKPGGVFLVKGKKFSKGGQLKSRKIGTKSGVLAKRRFGRRSGGSLYFYFLLSGAVFPYFWFKFQEIFLVGVCQLPDELVRDGFGEVMVSEGVNGAVIHEEVRPVGGIHELKVAPIRPFELFEVYLDAFNLLFSEGGVITVGVIR